MSSELNLAVETETLEMINSLLETDTNVKSGEYQITRKTLEHAVKRGSTEIVQLLLNTSKDKDLADYALVLAIKHKNIEMVESLINNGVDVDIEILEYAVKLGHTQIVKLFLTRDYKEVLHRLCSASTKSHFRTEHSYLTLERTLLELAIVNNHINIVDFFIANNANLDIEILKLSVDLGFIEITRSLLNNIEYKENEEDDLDDILELTIVNNDIEMIKLLIEYWGNSGYISLLAINHGLIKIFKMFFNEHVDVNYCLSKAAQRGYLEIVQMLVNDTDPCFNDCEALRLAAENGYTEIVDILLNNGSDVHAKDNYALKYSAINGHEETVELLLNFGASPSQEMIDNVTNDNIKYLLTNMSNTKMLKFAGKMN